MIKNKPAVRKRRHADVRARFARSAATPGASPRSVTGARPRAPARPPATWRQTLWSRAVARVRERAAWLGLRLRLGSGSGSASCHGSSAGSATAAAGPAPSGRLRGGSRSAEEAGGGRGCRDRAAGRPASAAMARACEG
eukprot:scaffold69815_cov64-Phaeocystis_antarctica.AAC.2